MRMNWFLVVSILGLVFASYLTYLHIYPEQLESNYCNINEFVSCSTVNQSPYAYIFGVPVAYLGMLGFVLFSILSVKDFKHKGPLFFVLVSVGFVFMIYLTIIELFVIHAVCIYCLAVFVIITILFGMVAKAHGKETLQFLKSIEVVD